MSAPAIGDTGVLPSRRSALRRIAGAPSVLLGLGGGLAGLGTKVALSSPAPAFSGDPIDASPDYQDPALLARAWQLPVARRFGQRVIPQRNRSSCGPSSLANVAISLGGAHSEASVVAGTGKCRFGICLGGLTLDELGDIARVNTWPQVTVLRGLSFDAFQAALPFFNDPARRYIVNFHRRPLFGRGHGHFSPIGGYLAERDLVFVLDVNADYRPFLVRPRRLFEAIDTTDDASGQKRGLLALSAS